MSTVRWEYIVWLNTTSSLEAAIDFKIIKWTSKLDVDEQILN